MNAYETAIRAMETPSMAEIIRIAKKHVPSLYRHAPWTCSELDRGKGILRTKQALNCYLSAYGLMHEHKMRYALKNSDIAGLERGYEVVDWGCGQGLASLCLLEHLKEQGAPMPSRITLVDASPAALDRAELHLAVMTQGRVELRRMETLLPSADTEDVWKDSLVRVDQPITIHLLSNVLDLRGVSNSRLARVIAEIGTESIVVCAAHRTVEISMLFFSRYFGDARQETLFEEARGVLGVLPNGHSYGAALRVFRAAKTEGVAAGGQDCFALAA